MQIRHNTQLLEQAVDLMVKRSAIPTLEAEAAAHEKIARANGFRRMATGGAIAVAAVGIGIGAMLVLGRGETVPEKPSPEIVQRAPEPTIDQEPGKPAEREKQTERVQPEENVAEEGKTERPRSPEPHVPPVPPIVEEPAKPDAVVSDYTKFLTRDTQFLGGSWTLTSGHHFNDENSPTWDKAWCYTRRLINGVDVNIELVNRLSPVSKPQAPVSPAETLASVGLNDDSARELAGKCAWLDGSSFGSADFEESPGRPQPQALLVQDGWDALGYDLPNMPIRNISFEQCRNQCQGDSKCAAITYNKRHSVCFMKGHASILIKSDEATMAAKPAVASSLQYSSLVFAKDTVVVGSPYSSTATRYPDCIMACASDQLCAGFNYDSNKTCTLMNAINSSADFRGVTSGMKAVAN